METYRASRSDNDASYDETELARFKSATMVNDCFIRRQIKEYTMLEDALTNDLPQLTFRGFLTDVRLGPFLRGGRFVYTTCPDAESEILPRGFLLLKNSSNL